MNDKWQVYEQEKQELLSLQEQGTQIDYDEYVRQLIENLGL